jgi:ABC-type branched-subunit amino acid transport system ATPase component/ABC-type branched-subunit amino acid transport system permease subunit
MLVVTLGLVTLEAPRQIIFIGLIEGLSIGLLSLGIVLIYRTSRVINFAVGSIGALAATMLALLVSNYGWNYWFALAAALATGVAFAAFVELTVITRLFTAPRVILLVATIGIAQLADLFRNALPDLGIQLGARYPLPFNGEWTVAGVRITSAEIIVLIAVPLIATGVSLLLGRTRVGKTVQAAASNADKARLSGINPKLVSTFVWTLSGLLAALTTVMLAGTKGQLVGLETLGPATLTRVLAAALIGSLVSFPRALTGGVVIGVLEALLRFNYPAQGGRIEALLFVGIAVSVWVITRRRRSAPQESFSFAPRVRPVPTALRQRWWVHNLTPLMALVGLAIAALLPLAITLPSRQFLWTEMLLTATLALSLVVLTGWTGQLSLGQATFAGIGALGTAALVRGATLGVGVGDASFDIDLPEIPFLAATIIMTAVCVCVALVIGLGALRVRGLMLAIVTLGFALAAQQYLWRTNFFSDGNATSVPLPRGSVGPFDLSSQRSYYWFSLALLALVVLLIARLRRSGIGRIIIAVRDNPDSAAAYTVSPTRAKLIGFGLAGGIAGFAGSALGGLFVTISFNDLFDVDASFTAVSVAVIGGIGSIAGPILGALWVVGLPALWPNNDLIPLLTSSVGLLILLMYFPGGLVQIGINARDALLTALARRASDDGPTARPSASAIATTTDRTGTRNADGSVLATDNLQVRFGARVAISAVNIVAMPGETIGLIGTNGAGKSTLLNAIGGYVPASGRVHLLGRDVSSLSAAQRARVGIGRSFQTASLFPDLTVRETVQVATEARYRTGLPATAMFLPRGFARGRQQRALADDIIGYLGLGRYADHFISDLSTGTRRIVELAGLIAIDQPVLCLDEPTAGVAQREAEAFGPLINQIKTELNATVIVIEHDMPLIMTISDRIYCMEAGQVIAEGEPEAVRADPTVIASYLGTDERAIKRSQHTERQATQ